MKTLQFLTLAAGKNGISSVRSNKGFTLVELIIVISIIIILAGLALNSFNTEGAKDRIREAQLNKMQGLLVDFKGTYGEFPNAAGKGKKYPATGCTVSGWKTLVDCLASTGMIEKDSKTYNDLLNDPSQDSVNSKDLKYTFQYGANTQGNKYRITALAGKQENPENLGANGKDAELGNRYITKVSENTKLDEIATVAE